MEKTVMTSTHLLTKRMSPLVTHPIASNFTYLRQKYSILGFRIQKYCKTPIEMKLKCARKVWNRGRVERSLRYEGCCYLEGSLLPAPAGKEVRARTKERDAQKTHAGDCF